MRSCTKEHVKDIHGIVKSTSSYPLFQSLLTPLVIQFTFLLIRENFVSMWDWLELSTEKSVSWGHWYVLTAELFWGTYSDWQIMLQSGIYTVTSDYKSWAYILSQAIFDGLIQGWAYIRGGGLIHGRSFVLVINKSDIKQVSHKQENKVNMY
jgi:hypothetical protein